MQSRLLIFISIDYYRYCHELICDAFILRMNMCRDPLLPSSSETTLTTAKEAFEPAFGGLTSVSWRAAMSIVTLRAVLMGWAVGVLVSAMNIRFKILL